MSDRDRIAYYQAEKARALEVIRLIEAGGWKFFESVGGEDLREVTAERLAEKKHDLETYDHLIRAWERLDAQGS
jgi:hypothetical protein